MKPLKRGAVLEFVNRLSYGKLQKHKTTGQVTLEDEQLIVYVESGKGNIQAAGKTVELYGGVGIFIPAKLEFVMKNTGNEPLTMYLISEPVPDGSSGTIHIRGIGGHRQATVQVDPEPRFADIVRGKVGFDRGYPGGFKFVGLQCSIPVRDRLLFGWT